jgi:hypothetical protein
MKELAALAYRDTSPESREFWKNELGQAIREIEAMYGEKLVDMKADLESQYNHKVMHKQIFYVYGFVSNACKRYGFIDRRSTILNPVSGQRPYNPRPPNHH